MANKAIKYRIYPTNEQSVLFAKTFGCCRKVYLVKRKMDFLNSNQQNIAVKHTLQIIRKVQLLL